MARIIWSPQALEDLKSIYAFIAEDSADRAALFIDRIIESTDRLQNFPLLGGSLKKLIKKDAEKLFTDLTVLCLK